MKFCSAISLVISLTLPAPVSALSCLQPDVGQTYQIAAQSQNSYIIVLGKLSFDGSAHPPAVRDDSDEMSQQLPARLVGKGLTQQGFNASLDRIITLNLNCLGVWCGHLAPDETMLVFLRRHDDSYVLDVGPCPQFAFPHPSKAVLKQVQQCHATGSCASD